MAQILHMNRRPEICWRFHSFYLIDRRTLSLALFSFILWRANIHMISNSCGIHRSHFCVIWSKKSGIRFSFFLRSFIALHFDRFNRSRTIRFCFVNVIVVRVCCTSSHDLQCTAERHSEHTQTIKFHNPTECHSLQWWKHISMEMHWNF